MKRLLFLLLVLAFTAKAQLPADSLGHRLRPDSLKTGILALDIYNFNYQRNYEYFNRIQDGYTLYGTQLEPQLVYYAHPKLLVTAGIHLRKDFGNDGIYKTYPMFSLRYRDKDATLIFGSLDGTINHGYSEIMYDLEKRITDPVEYGTQYVIEKRGFFMDAWLNWEKMIYKGSAEQEEIVGGISMEKTLLDRGRWKLSLPVQLVAYHKGGQIDVNPDPLTTLLNSSLGIKASLITDGFISGVFTENYYHWFNDFSRRQQSTFNTGRGMYLNAGITGKFGRLVTSYWKGNNFQSILGMPLYQSVSQHINHPGLIEREREIIFLRYSYQKQLIPGLYIDSRLEPFVDLQTTGRKKIEFSNSMFLVYKQQFNLVKKKQ